MKGNIDFLTLKNCSLFKDIKTEIEIEQILTYSHYTIKKYKKNEYIQIIGDKISSLGIIVEGSCDIVKEDLNGNLTIISQIGKGNLFGESIIFSKDKISPVSIMTTDNTIIYYLDLSKFLIKSNIDYLNKIVFKNLIEIISNKNIILNKKISILSQKTIRDKLMTYFEDIIITNNKKTFKLPTTKTKVANHLGVDRSAMSRELKSMQDDGIITIENKIITVINS